MFVMLSILLSQFINKDSKKTENSEHIVVLLLFLFTLDGLKTFGKEDKMHSVKCLNFMLGEVV